MGGKSAESVLAFPGRDGLTDIIWGMRCHPYFSKAWVRVHVDGELFLLLQTTVPFKKSGEHKYSPKLPSSLFSAVLQKSRLLPFTQYVCVLHSKRRGEQYEV